MGDGKDHRVLHFMKPWPEETKEWAQFAQEKINNEEQEQVVQSLVWLCDQTPSFYVFASELTSTMEGTDSL